jgi:hypothetical protein
MVRVGRKMLRTVCLRRNRLSPMGVGWMIPVRRRSSVRTHRHRRPAVGARRIRPLVRLPGGVRPWSLGLPMHRLG